MNKDDKVLGHMVDVPVTLTVAVRGSRTEAEAIKAAQSFFVRKLERLGDDNNVQGWKVDAYQVTEISLEHPEDKPSTVVDTLLMKDGEEVWTDDLDLEEITGVELPVNTEAEEGESA